MVDVAKAGAILVYSEKSTAEHLASQQMPAQSLPTIAIPTTAGTGTEVTSVSVLIDRATNIKRSFRADCMMPKAAIVDPELMCSCPPALTAASGMDALTQAIESYCSKNAYALTDALAEKAIDLIAHSLLRAYENGNDIEARSAMAMGSTMAGMALANARLGAVHGLAHPLGGKFGIAHGLACAILLPAVLEFNRSTLERQRPNKYGRMAEIFGADPVEFTQSLLRKMNVPLNLKQFDIAEDQLDALAAEGVTSGSTKANPREASCDDLKGILRRLL